MNTPNSTRLEWFQKLLDGKSETSRLIEAEGTRLDIAVEEGHFHINHRNPDGVQHYWKLNDSAVPVTSRLSTEDAVACWFLLDTLLFGLVKATR